MIPHWNGKGIRTAFFKRRFHYETLLMIDGYENGMVW